MSQSSIQIVLHIAEYSYVIFFSYSSNWSSCEALHDVTPEVNMVSSYLLHTNTHADEIRKTFKQLGYDIHERQNENATESEIINLLTALNKYLWLSLKV